METFERNTAAEKSKFVTIPKGTTLPCGIESVDTYINTINGGENKGREFDKYKLKLRILAGDFAGKISTVSVSCQVERSIGVDGTRIDNWGNSRNYIDLLRAIGYDFEDSAIPLPGSQEELKEVGDSFAGKFLNVTFDTYTFKNDEGKEITINTVKGLGVMSADQQKQIAAELGAWKMENAAKTGGGALSLDDDDDDLPY